MRRLTGLLMTLGLLLAALPTTTAGAEPPTIHVADVVVTEPSGRNGIATVAVPVVLDSAPTSAVLVSWRTVAGSAGPSDVVITSGSFQINAGSQGGGVPIDIRADRTAESTESFTLELTSVSGAVIADGIGRIDIRDAATGLAVADVTVMEPDAGVSTSPSRSPCPARRRRPSRSPGSCAPGPRRSAATWLPPPAPG
jgi:hypothetical protein